MIPRSDVCPETRTVFSLAATQGETRRKTEETHLLLLLCLCKHGVLQCHVRRGRAHLGTLLTLEAIIVDELLGRLGASVSRALTVSHGASCFSGVAGVVARFEAGAWVFEAVSWLVRSRHCSHVHVVVCEVECGELGIAVMED